MRPEFQDIVDEVSRLLGAPAILEERSLALIAFCAHDREIDSVRERSILQRQSTPEIRERFESFGISTATGPVRIPADPRSRVMARLCLPVRWQGVTYGYLWLLDDGREIGEDRLPRAMSLAARAGALMATELRSREDLGYKLRDLISVSSDIREQAAMEISDLGYVPRGVPVAAAVLRYRAVEREPWGSRPDGDGPQEPHSREALATNLWRLPSNVLAHLGPDHTVLLVPLDDPDDLSPARAVVRRVWELDAEAPGPRGGRPRSVLLAGLGDPRPDLGQAHASWQEARLATRIGEFLPNLEPVVEWGRLGVYRLLARIPQNELRDSTLDPAVRRLFDCGDPELIRTVEVYLDEAGNAQRSAAELAVHRQTLYYRLHKVEQITGLSLSAGEDRLVLHLGLKMGHLFGLLPV
jgi:hypothetical protein